MTRLENNQYFYESMRQQMHNWRDMIDGELNRISVSDDKKEVETLYKDLQQRIKDYYETRMEEFAHPILEDNHIYKVNYNINLYKSETVGSITLPKDLVFVVLRNREEDIEIYSLNTGKKLSHDAAIQLENQMRYATIDKYLIEQKESDLTINQQGMYESLTSKNKEEIERD